MLFTSGGFQMLRLNPSKVVVLVTAEDSSTTKHTIVLFVEQCINENNILYEGGVYVRKPALALVSYWGDILILYGV